MEYLDYDMDGYKLHVIKTNRFKTVFYSVNIRFKDEKENERYTSMLSRILLHTSKKYDSLKEINIACANIYDPSYNIKILESGSQDVLSLTASFANEKYTEKGMNEQNIKFLSDFLFNPKVVDGGFDSDVFENQKAKLLEYYKSLKDMPRNYAESRLSEEMQIKGYQIFKLDELIRSITSLTRYDLYDFYKKIMNEGILDVFVCGDVDEKEVYDILKKTIIFKGHGNRNINHLVKQKNFNLKPNVVIESSLNTQSNLVIGVKFSSLSDFERKYVFVLYSWILGGGMNSLLNQTVREKNSLCYYIYAIRQILFETMRIYAGINGEDFEKTYNLIQNEMNNMEKGNFADGLFEGVKEIYYNSLVKIEDSQSDVVSNYISELFLGNDNISKRHEEMSKVTKEDVIALAKKAHIDTVYLLKGEIE